MAIFVDIYLLKTDDNIQLNTIEEKCKEVDFKNNNTDGEQLDYVKYDDVSEHISGYWRSIWYYSYQKHQGRFTPLMDTNSNRISHMQEGQVQEAKMHGFNRKMFYIGSRVDLGFYKDDKEYGKNIHCSNGRVLQ